MMFPVMRDEFFDSYSLKESYRLERASRKQSLGNYRGSSSRASVT